MRTLSLIVLTFSVCASHADVLLIESLWEGHLFEQADAEIAKCDKEDNVCIKLKGDRERLGLGRPADAARGMLFYIKAARGGHTKAAEELAKGYETGSGVPQDAKQAFYWYEKAALESPYSARRYAEIALANNLVDLQLNPFEALRFASEYGDPKASFILGVELHKRGDPNWAQHLTKASASLPEASLYLAEHFHRNGAFKEAHALFEKSGDSPLAKAYLGYYAEHGLIRPYDKSAAFNLYKQSTGIKWAESGLTRLTKNAESIELLGFPLHGSTKTQARTELTRNGARLLSKTEHSDSFSLIVEGSPIAASISYLPMFPHYITEVTYRFDSENRTKSRDNAKKLRETLESKYGLPKEKTRKRGVSKFVWNEEDFVVRLHDAPKERLQLLTYQLKPYWSTMKRFLTNNKQEENSFENTL